MVYMSKKNYQPQQKEQSPKTILLPIGLQKWCLSLVINSSHVEILHHLEIWQSSPYNAKQSTILTR